MYAFVYDSSAPLGFKLVSNHPKPEVSQSSDTKVLVRIHAAAINPVDYKLPKLPVVGYFKKGSVAGLDFSGVIEQANDATGFKKGDEVFGNHQGTIAEFCAADVSKISHKPTGLSHVEAAALPTVALTGLQGLRDNPGHPVKDGSRVLVVGGSGGTGSAGIQIAKAMGAAHVASINSAKNAKFVRDLGADEVIDYKDPAALSALSDSKRPDTEQFDLVYDCVSSIEDMNYESLVRPSLKSTGQYVAINTPSVSDWVRMAVGWQRPGFHLFVTNHSSKDLGVLARMVDESKLKPTVEAVYPLKDEAKCREAFESLQSRRVVGKVVIDCIGDSQAPADANTDQKSEK